MNSIQNNSKKQTRKFNIIYFTDSNKTHHYKFNLTFIKIVITLFVLLNTSSFILIYISYSMIKNSTNQEKYIVNFKKDILNYYFEKTYLKDERKKEHENIASMIENEIKKENMTTSPSIVKSEVKIENKNLNATQAIENTIPTAPVNPPINNIAQETAKPKNPSDTIIPPVVLHEKKAIILEDSGIKIENPKFVQSDSSTKITFSLLNTGTVKTISGNICLVIIGSSPQGENKIFKIPNHLELSTEQVPFTCGPGNLVKFSRLRPSEFNINIDKNEFIIKKINIYFSDKNKPGVVLNSF
ncbi:hypothetical protein JCM31447_03760 [Fluviispira sanaruensis]|uniref:Uncharacterized protein n=2 Tax=Fluviispira sanaruensis TaxID=2493639 RepID=A0A4V0P245_FLUSA|nr:hypothetical protein JCM31447_03760 [Fluviispira sanaruensis]